MLPDTVSSGSSAPAITYSVDSTGIDNIAESAAALIRRRLSFPELQKPSEWGLQTDENCLYTLHWALSFVQYQLQEKQVEMGGGKLAQALSRDDEVQSKLKTINHWGQKLFSPGVFDGKLHYLDADLGTRINAYLDQSEFKTRVSEWKVQEQKDLCKRVAEETKTAQWNYKQLMSSSRHKLHTMMQHALTGHDSEKEKELRKLICISEHANILLQEMIQSSSGGTVDTEAPPAYSGKTGDSSNAEVASE